MPPSGYCLRTPWGGLFGALGQPRPTKPPPHIRKDFLRRKMKIYQRGRKLRPISGTQTFIWPLTHPPTAPGGGGGAIGQVWTHHCRSSRACPMAFIALSVPHVFVRPLALLVFQTVPSPCLPGWGQNCGPRFWALPPGHTTHMILSPGRGVYVVSHVWVCAYLGCACLRWPLLATHPWLRGFPGSWRARGADGGG